MFFDYCFSKLKLVGAVIPHECVRVWVSQVARKSHHGIAPSGANANQLALMPPQRQAAATFPPAAAGNGNTQFDACGAMFGMMMTMMQQVVTSGQNGQQGPSGLNLTMLGSGGNAGAGARHGMFPRQEPVPPALSDGGAGGGADEVDEKPAADDDDADDDLERMEDAAGVKRKPAAKGAAKAKASGVKKKPAAKGTAKATGKAKADSSVPYFANPDPRYQAAARKKYKESRKHGFDDLKARRHAQQAGQAAIA